MEFNVKWTFIPDWERHYTKEELEKKSDIFDETTDKLMKRLTPKLNETLRDIARDLPPQTSYKEVPIVHDDEYHKITQRIMLGLAKEHEFQKMERRVFEDFSILNLPFEVREALYHSWWQVEHRAKCRLHFLAMRSKGMKIEENFYQIEREEKEKAEQEKRDKELLENQKNGAQSSVAKLVINLPG